MIDNKEQVTDSVSYSYESKKKKSNSKIFKPNETKIVEIGQIKKRKFLISVDKNGKIRIRDIKKWNDGLKELNKLRKQGLITNDQYDELQQNFINNLVEDHGKNKYF